MKDFFARILKALRASAVKEETVPKDLNFLPCNKSEDLHDLYVAVISYLAMFTCLPTEQKQLPDVKAKIQTLIGWKNLIQGAMMDAEEREREEWVKREVKDIFDRTWKSHPTRP